MAIEECLFSNYSLKGLYIELTSQCNLRCIHCYNESGESKSELSNKAIRNLINNIPEKKGLEITLSGGEPLLYPKVWDVIELLKAEKFERALMITNATLITAEIASKIETSGVGVQISLNGSSSESHDKLCGAGSFQRNIKGLSCLLEEKLANRIVVRCMLSKLNQHDALPTIRFLIKKGIRQINFAMLIPIGRSKDNMQQVYLSAPEVELLLQNLSENEEIKEYKEQGINITIPKGYSGGCPLIHDNLNGEKIPITPRIDSKGNVYLCQLFSGEQFSVGNVYDSDILSILNGTDFVNLVKFLRYGIYFMDDCNFCVWKNSCGHGCPALSLANGSVQETDGNCHFRKKDFLKEYLENKESQEVFQF